MLLQEHSGEDPLSKKVEEISLGAMGLCILCLAAIRGGQPAAWLSRPANQHVAPRPKNQQSRHCPSQCRSASSSSTSPQPLRGAREALMTQEVLPTLSSSGPSSAPHDFITFYGAASSSLKARFGPSFHRGRGSIYTGETARPAQPLTHGLFTRCARESYSEKCHAWQSPATRAQRHGSRHSSCGDSHRKHG